MEPGQAYSDADVRLTLTGDNFLPATTLDPASGTRIAVIDGFHARVGKASQWVGLTDLAWQSTGQMAATLPSALAGALPTEYLDVELSDPRGQQVVLESAFQELGPDLTPPIVTIPSPAASTPVGAGTLLRGSIHASDAPPGMLAALEWSYFENGVKRDSGRCPIVAQSVEADCTFEVRVGKDLKGGEEIQIVAVATDGPAGRNHGVDTRSFTVRAPARVGTISPNIGGTAGGTDIVITGFGFIAGTRAVLDGVPLIPNGGIVIDENTLSGHTPAHAEGLTSVTVSTPLGQADRPLPFTYQPPPLVESITPNIGAADTEVVLKGKNFTTDTRIYFGSTLDGAVPLAQRRFLVTSTITGWAPAGIGQTTVWAFDKALGFTRLPAGFTWETP